MKCNKCGKDLNKDDKFCPSCGEKVNNTESNNTEIDNKAIPTETNKVEEKQWINGLPNDTALCILSILCFTISPVISGIMANLARADNAFSPMFALMSTIFRLLALAALPIAIYTKVKYPDCKFAKILIIIYIIVIIIYVIFVVIAVLLLVELIKSCSSASMPGIIFNLW